jgi:NADPH2:quinone reductase
VFDSKDLEMRAVQISSSGGPEVLSLTEVEKPEPAPTQLLVRNLWAGINYIDIYQRSGRYPLEYPVTLGLEGSGEVVAVGSDVTTFKVGDLVCWGWAQGSYAEYTLVNQDKAVQVPSGVSMDIAAAAMMQGLTAHYLITSVYQATSGDYALVHAAAGGAGLFLCQMLKARGVQVIGTVSNQAKEELARAAGAAHVIRYDKEDFEQRVNEITLGQKCDVVYDSVGKDTFEASLKCLKPRGTLALFGAASGAVPPFDLQRLSSLGSLNITRPTLAHFIQDSEELQWRCKEIFDEVTAGRLKVSVSKKYELEEAKQAHIDIESRATSGKLLLKISDES